MLNVFYFRILGRPSDPLIGVHVGLLAGRGLVVPGRAGLSKAVKQYILYVQKYVIYFTTVTLVVSSDIWTQLPNI